MRQVWICFYCHLFANFCQQQCSEVTEGVRNYRQKMPWAWHWFLRGPTKSLGLDIKNIKPQEQTSVILSVLLSLFFFMLKSDMKHKQTGRSGRWARDSPHGTILSVVSSVGSWQFLIQPRFIQWNTVYCFLLSRGCLSNISWVSLHDVTLRNSLFDSAVIVQYEEVPITAPLWRHPMNSPSDLALIVACCLFRPTKLGFTPDELDCSRQLPHSCLCVVGYTLFITWARSARCEDDRCFSCLLLQPPYTQAVHTLTQASPVGRALLNVFGSMQTEATHMHLAGWGEGQHCRWPAITKKWGQTFYPPNLKQKNNIFKSMVFALKMYCIC